MDAFPAADIGLLRGAAMMGHSQPRPAFLLVPSLGVRGEPMLPNTSGLSIPLVSQLPGAHMGGSAVVA
jgi:hypothetical protein